MEVTPFIASGGKLSYEIAREDGEVFAVTAGEAETLLDLLNDTDFEEDKRRFE